MLTVVSRPDSNILYMLSSWCQTRFSSVRPQKEYMRAYCGYMSWTTTDSSSGKTELFSSNYLVGQFIQTSCERRIYYMPNPARRLKRALTF